MINLVIEIWKKNAVLWIEFKSIEEGNKVRTSPNWKCVMFYIKYTISLRAL